MRATDTQSPTDTLAPSDTIPSQDTVPTPPQLSLLAGHLGGAGNTDGTGAAARFNAPRGLVSDGVGHLYVADNTNNVIREVTLATGAVTTLAGSGSFAQVDGVGRAASLETPSFLALVGTKLYVNADRAIRAIDLSTMAVSTLSLTPSLLQLPTGMVTDGNGNLFVADRSTHTIDQIVLSTGAVTVFAGSGASGKLDGVGKAAQFDTPVGLTTDGTNLYVADFSGCTIRQIVISSATVSTLAGTAFMNGTVDGVGAAARFGFPVGVLYDGAGDLYVTEDAAVRKIVLATDTVVTIAGSATPGDADGVGGAASFSEPYQPALDGFGNLDLGDSNNDTLRQIAVLSGTVTTYAGVPPTAGRTDGTGTAALLDGPVSPVWDGKGHVYFADYWSGALRQVDMATGIVTTVATVSPGTNDLATDGTTLYLSNSTFCTVTKVDIASGTTSPLAGKSGACASADGTGVGATFGGPAGLALDPSGNPLYVADVVGDDLRRINVLTTVVTTVAGTAGKAGSTDGTGTAALFTHPTGVVVDAAGDVYIADTGNSTLRKLTVSSGAVTTVAGLAGIAGIADGAGSAARFSQPDRLAMDGSGLVYVSDGINSLYTPGLFTWPAPSGTVRRFDPATQQVTTVVGVAGQLKVVPGPLPGGLSNPSGVAALPGGQLVITDDNENALLWVH
jgi:sugar lactone lactonase YvrE